MSVENLSSRVMPIPTRHLKKYVYYKPGEHQPLSYWTYTKSFINDITLTTPIKSLPWSVKYVNHPLHEKYCKQGIEVILLSYLRLRNDLTSESPTSLGDLAIDFMLPIIKVAAHTLPEDYTSLNESSIPKQIVRKEMLIQSNNITISLYQINKKYVCKEIWSIMKSHQGDRSNVSEYINGQLMSLEFDYDLYNQEINTRLDLINTTLIELKELKDEYEPERIKYELSLT